MKTKITSVLLMAAFWLAGAFAPALGQNVKDIQNFIYIDDFETDVSLWWTPQGSGSTAGIILEDDEGNLVTYNAHETTIVNPATGSTGSMKLAIQWNNAIAYGGTPTHLVRQHMPAGNANIPEKRFQPGQALEVFIYGDGSGNRFRFMTRDGIPQLEGSKWISIDWTGWKRITWDYNKPENVMGWVNGNGQMEGVNFYFDSFQITKDADGTTQSALLYFDDLRIVDPFDVNFNITNGNGSEVISIDNVVYEAGVTNFSFFPGEYQYFVQRDGFITSIGTFEVDDQDVTVDVTLQAGSDPEYTVAFTVIANDELLTDALVSIDGQSLNAAPYNFQLTPGFYTYTVTHDMYYDAQGSVTVTNSNVFVNVIMEEIPDVYDRLILSWDVASTANSAQFRAEHYSVWIADVAPGSAFNAEDFEMVFEETLSTTIPNWQYQARSIDISAYQQKNIRVAFRHHESTDKDRVVIDNVKIVGTDDSDEGFEVLFNEDFTGGVPAGFDPENPQYDDSWLPAGWLAVDADDDGFNWFFSIRVEQDLTYKAHMRSQSWDSQQQQALTPDNWLVTPILEMPWVFFYPVTINVKDAEGTALTGAVIKIDGKTYAAGVNTFSLTNGTYTYEVSLEDYITQSGTFTVDNAALTFDVVMELIPLYDVTFNVNMNQHSGFVIGSTNVYFSGTFFDWAVPGSDPVQQLNPTNNVFIFTKTIQLAAGTYQYKYFDGPSFDNGEWQGATNRTLWVTGTMTVNDVYGVPSSITDLQNASVKMYPNPASSSVMIASDKEMTRISVYDMAGQMVYSADVANISHTLMLDGFSNGLYMVRIFTSSGMNSLKLQVLK